MRPRFKRLLPITLRIPARTDDYFGLPQPLIAPQRAAHLEPVAVRHYQIANDDVGTMRFGELDAFFRLARVEHLPLFELQDFADELPKLLVIVNNQDSFHGGTANAARNIGQHG